MASKSPPVISLCMIVKNEEKDLAQCLESAVKLVDEIVILDTGSTDNTIRIASSFHARIYHYKWQDDFSAARNKSLKYAEGNWIFYLDGDEYLETGNNDTLRKAAIKKGKLAYNFKIKNLLDGGKHTSHLQVRMFKNRSDINFRNIIYNQLCIPGGISGNHIGTVDATIVHKGYKSEYIQSREKNKRVRKLFAKQLQKHPDDVYSWYKYSRLLNEKEERNMKKKATQHAYLLFSRLGKNKAAGLPYGGEIIANHALDLFKDGNLQKAYQICEINRGRIQKTANFYYVFGQIATGLGKYKEALNAFEQCISFDRQLGYVPPSEGISSYLSLQNMAIIYFNTGKINKAEDLLEKAIDANPDRLMPYLILAELNVMENRRDKAAGIIDRFNWPRVTDGFPWMEGARFFLRYAFHDRATAFLKRAAGYRETADEALRLLGNNTPGMIK